ncbi:MAG: hypothetical protein WC445_02275 [Patescibacteria group bacterium]
MDTLRSTAHLQREIGDELFSALVSSDNTEAVREFAETLVKSSLPTEMTIGGRTYEILSFLWEGETSVVGRVMVARAERLGANLGKEDCEFLLAHQDEVPAALRGKVVFVFPDWRFPVDRGLVACVRWHDDGWCQDWRWLGYDWGGGFRVLRRK